MKRYSFEYGRPARLEITWDGGALRVRSNITIKADGQVLASFPGRKELEAGREFQLRDGSRLRVELIRDYFNIIHEGRSVQWIGDATNLRNLSWICGALCVLRWLLAGPLAAEASKTNPALSAWSSAAALLLGLTFAAIGSILIKRSYFVGLLAFILTFSLEEIFFDVFIPLQGSRPVPLLETLLFLALVIMLVTLPVLARLGTRRHIDQQGPL